MPAYLNGYTAIPLISGLLEMGMSSGDRARLRHRRRGLLHPRRHRGVGPGVFVLYLVLGLGGAMLSGVVYQMSGAPI